MSRGFGWPELQFVLHGLLWTLGLSAVALTAGGVGGMIIALARVSRLRVLRIVAGGYIGLFQGTPVLMQLFLAFFGLAVLTGVQMDAWPAVTLAFTLYAGAFLGEIWRGAIQAVPPEQWEAARALGLRRPATLLRVVLPQAVRLAIPPTVGFLVQLIKSTAVASIIGFVEVTRAGQLMVNVTFRPMLVYPLVALLYFAVCWPVSLLSGRLERRLDARGSGSPRR
ncbi:MAG TPA: amino acid ABC transporter permease [Acetobacteraceae bacterium]|nr:amino acid ABC transporter permease [Acetobacteraceae bacterium]